MLLPLLVPHQDLICQQITSGLHIIINHRCRRNGSIPPDIINNEDLKASGGGMLVWGTSLLGTEERFTLQVSSDGPCRETHKEAQLLQLLRAGGWTAPAPATVPGAPPASRVPEHLPDNNWAHSCLTPTLDSAKGLNPLLAMSRQRPPFSLPCSINDKLTFLLGSSTLVSCFGSPLAYSGLRPAEPALIYVLVFRPAPFRREQG